MLVYYNKHTIEATITKSRAKLLSNVINNLCSLYSPIISSSLKQLPGKNHRVFKRERDIINWFKSPHKEDLLIEIFTLKESVDLIFFIELKDIESLKTSFGKKQHKKNRGYLVIYSFSRVLDVHDKVDVFLKSCAKYIKNNFRLSNIPEISSISTINDKFESLKKKKHSTEPITSEILSVIELFKDKDFRSTIIRTRQAKDPTFQNILKSTGLNEVIVQNILSTSIDKGIMVRHYNCICSNCRSTLARVTTKESISNMAKDGVACPSCRTKVSDESCTDCFIVEDSYGRLLEGSKWMAMFVRDKLEKFPSVTRVLESVVDGPNELDLVANLDGSLMLIELKDNRFSIGHAYSFVGKCTQYQPDVSIIIATEGIDDDVKEYIKNIGIKVNFIDRLDILDDTFTKILSKQISQTFTQLTNEVSWDLLFNREILGIYGIIDIMPEEPYQLAYRRGYKGRGVRWVTE